MIQDSHIVWHDRELQQFDIRHMLLVYLLNQSFLRSGKGDLILIIIVNIKLYINISEQYNNISQLILMENKKNI